MRSKSIVLLALALGCGLVASIGISQVMDRNRGNGDDVERQPVFVAMTDIAANGELNAQNIKLEEWPKKIIPQGALTKLEEVEGKKLRTKLYAGEPILQSKLLGADDLLGAAKDIPAGYRVAHVKVDAITGSSNLILPGDRVDVLVFRHTGNESNATAAKIVLQDIKVFAIDTHTESEYTRTKAEEQSEQMVAKTIALLVTPSQSVILHAATEISGAVRLVLRNPEDDQHVKEPGATIGDIFGSEQKSGRESEKGDAAEGDLSDWLTNQQKQPPVEAIKATPPAAPAVPPLVSAPVAPTRRMRVLYGSQLMQVDLPGKGELPTGQPGQDSMPVSGQLTSSPSDGLAAPGDDQDAPTAGDQQSDE